MKPQVCNARHMQQLLLCLVAAYVLFYSFSPMQIPGDNCSRKYTCTVISLDNTTQVPHACALFVASRFREEEFAWLSVSAKNKLRNVKLQDHSKDLSSNIIVSIFLNHMRVWQQVAASDTPVLVLEDDRHAAHTLLTASLPLETHVDVFLHNMVCVVCVVRKTTLYIVLSSPVRTSCQVSTHMPTLMLHRLRLVMAGEVSDWRMSECTWRWMPL